MFFYSESTNVVNNGQTVLLLKGEGLFIEDTSPSNYSNVAYGTTTISTTQKKYGNSSIKLTAQGDHITFPDAYNILTTGSFTLESWIYKTGGGNGVIIGTWNWFKGNNSGWQLIMNSSNNIVLYASDGIWNSSANVLVSDITASMNTWNHLAITRDNSNMMRLFINGQLCASASYNYTLNREGGTGGNIKVLSIGNNYAGNTIYNQFGGYIDNLRITTGAALYTTNFTPPGDF